ncbi:MAG: gamma-glutamyltransferase, partial [Gammaproteobacteria bacterium]|nr:gamma-glutamyltransferase [Gammaproteobacteria bacterium]
MLRSKWSTRGMVSAPHHLAAQAGSDILREGGNAIEAMIAAAASVAVVYPHMNSIGGDGFWLVHVPGREPVAIDACGAAARNATAELYREAGLTAIPSRGPLAANTVAGTLSGWEAALALSASLKPGRSLPLGRLLEHAVYHAEHGVPVSKSQSGLTRDKRAELEDVPGFAACYMPDGVPPVGALLKQPRLGRTLRSIASAGPGDFYRGDLARSVAEDLRRAGSPLTLADLNAQHGIQGTPLSVRVRHGAPARLFNFPPPTQGLASLLILAVYDRLEVASADGFEHLHGMVEATKQAFMIRDRHVTDPAHMSVDPASLLSEASIAGQVAAIDRRRALTWPRPTSSGDTVWMGAIDADGMAVSFIQSLYWEFG